MWRFSLMLPFSKLKIPGTLLLLLPFFLAAQPCNFSLSGRVFDQSTGIALPFATVFLEEAQKGAVTDSAGLFEISGLCSGEYLLRVSHVGSETYREKLKLETNIYLPVGLNHFTEFLNEVVIHGEKEGNTTQVSSSVSQQVITENASKDFAEILKTIQGVNVLKAGAGISKPVIHGLYGNRIDIINNGIVHSGQQWGNDHAPEIDPLAADHLAVVKGTSALQYSGGTLGGLVLVDTKNISGEQHLTGNVNYIGETNGFGNTINSQLEKNGKLIAWRLTGTFKLKGDQKTPDYYLTNTGKRETSASLQLEKALTENWDTEFYYSLFSTEIGILRGSHIGNLTDLEEALQRDVPFYTKEKFSYEINAPSQKIQHHLLKLKTKYQPDEKRFWEFTYGGQINNRKEFDVRRSGRSAIPALSLFQIDHSLQGRFFQQLPNGTVLKSGVQLGYTDNTNNPETGILPLIPDYREYKVGSYFIFQNSKDKIFYELGGRYDLNRMNVWAISQSLPHTIEKKLHRFQDWSLSGGLKYEPTKDFAATLNLGGTTRAPAINELYSFGLHQGVSGIEEGDPELTTEKSLKVLLSADWIISDFLLFQGTGYYQAIRDYIYLQPQPDPRLTIRGAFPVFLYTQNDAVIYGSDFLMTWEPTQGVNLTAKYAVVKGKNREQNKPLVYMPADNISAKVTFSPKDYRIFHGNSFSVGGEYTFEQKELLPSQDFVPPPEGYFLLSAAASTSFDFAQSALKFSVKAENLLNTRYRDYLNRLRYFADEPGRFILLQLNYSF